MTDTNINTIDNKNPLELFDSWFSEGEKSESIFPDSFTLATVDKDGQPHARTLLLKGRQKDQFHFYTNYNSRKGEDLEASPKATMLFYWKSIQRQITVEGHVKKLSRSVSEAYFSTRPRGSQIGAWASQQSQPLNHRDDLLARTRHFEEKFDGEDVPCPEHWGGYTLTPTRIEFWQLGEFRLHERCVYTKKDDGAWNFIWLNP